VNSFFLSRNTFFAISFYFIHYILFTIYVIWYQTIKKYLNWLPHLSNKLIRPSIRVFNLLFPFWSTQTTLVFHGLRITVFLLPWIDDKGETVLKWSHLHYHVTVLQCPLSGIFIHMCPTYTDKNSVTCCAYCENGPRVGSTTDIWTAEAIS